MAYPNAGLPNDLGDYDECAATTAGQVREWAEQGIVNIVGGCCGTTPAHIARHMPRRWRASPRAPSRRRSAAPASPASSR